MIAAAQCPVEITIYEQSMMEKVCLKILMGLPKKSAIRNTAVVFGSPLHLKVTYK